MGWGLRIYYYVFQYNLEIVVFIVNRSWVIDLYIFFRDDCVFYILIVWMIRNV